MHIHPDFVKDIIQKCVLKANKFVIHMETQGVDKILNGPREICPENKVSRKVLCVHNYDKIYSELGLSASIKTITCPEEDAQHIISVKVGK